MPPPRPPATLPVRVVSVIVAETAEVPVRMYTSGLPIDVIVFLSETSDGSAEGWLIDQIHFLTDTFSDVPHE